MKIGIGSSSLTEVIQQVTKTHPYPFSSVWTQKCSRPVYERSRFCEKVRRKERQESDLEIGGGGSKNSDDLRPPGTGERLIEIDTPTEGRKLFGEKLKTTAAE